MCFVCDGGEQNNANKMSPIAGPLDPLTVGVKYSGFYFHLSSICPDIQHGGAAEAVYYET